MRSSSPHLHRVRHAGYPERRLHASFRRQRKPSVKDDYREDEFSNLFVAVVLAILIFVSLVVLPTILNWIFPT